MSINELKNIKMDYVLINDFNLYKAVMIFALNEEFEYFFLNR